MMKRLRLLSPLCAVLTLVLTLTGCGGGGPDIVNVEHSLSGDSVVITWDTGVNATSQVEYGTTTAYGNTTSISTTLTANHSVEIGNLDPLNTYHYRVRSKNAAGDESISDDYSFTTGGAVISNVDCSGITGSNATISWDTNARATSQVEYGTTTSYGTSTQVNTAMTLDHNVTLTGLSPTTTYHYRVKSKDSSGMETMSADKTFTTDDVQISAASCTNISNTSATVTWNTDVPTTSQVEYGTTTAYGSSAQGVAWRTSHRVKVTGLSAGVTYHYRVKSIDSAGNEIISADGTFTTRNEGGTITAAFTSGPSTLNPFWAQRYPQTAFVGLIMEPLVYVNEDGSVDPCLAKSWDQSTSGLEWTINIDPDAKWSDGEAVTADDVIFTFNQHWENDGEWSQARQNKTMLASLDAGDAETVNTVPLAFNHYSSSGDTIVRTTGSFITDGWEAGMFVKVSGSDSNDTSYYSSGYRIASVTATTITLKDQSELTNESASTGARLTATGPAPDALIKVDDDTVKFTLNDSYNSAVFLPSLGTVFICPEHVWTPKIDSLVAAGEGIQLYALEEESGAVISSLLIGSGPFAFNDYVVEQYMRYETNDDYWTGERAYVDEVIFKIFANPDPATLALSAGEVDCLAMVETPAIVATLLMDQDINVDIVDNYNSSTMFWLNMRYPPLHILEVRQAIDMALNKDDIITYAAFGYGTDAQMIPFAPGLSESNPDVAWKKTYVDGSGEFLPLWERIDDANALLDSIPGMSDYVEGETRTWTDPDTGVGPIELSFEGLYLSSPTYQRAAELVAEQMEEIGIEIVPTVETGAFGPKVFSGWQVWNYETIIFGYPSAPDFDGFVKQWGQPVFAGNYDGSVVGWNNDPTLTPPKLEGYRPQTYETPYEDPTAAELELWEDIYNELVALSAPVNEDLRDTRVITDDTARLAAVLQVQEDFMDSLPIITLYHPQFMSAYRTDDFTGWGNPEGIFLYGFMPPPVSVKTLMNVETI